MHFCKDFVKGKKHLRFFGSEHSLDDVHINFLREKLKEFKPDLILIEGGYEKANFDSEKEALEKGLEMGFVNFYAKKNKILLEGNDPNYSKTISFLESFYDKRHIFLLFVLLFSLFKPRNCEEKKIITYMEDAINNFKSISNWENFDYSFDNFKLIFSEILKEKFEIKEDHTKWINPELEMSILNIISRKEDLYRDSYMINKIMEEFKEHDRIFVIKGTHHLITMEKVLGELFR